jgi:hypothetical protein
MQCCTSTKSTFYVEIDMGIAKIMIDMTMRKKWRLQTVVELKENINDLLI